MLEHPILAIATILGAFGWGLYVQEIIAKKQQRKQKENRILIDAPFSPEQSETIMTILQKINEAVKKSMDDNNRINSD